MLPLFKTVLVLLHDGCTVAKLNVTAAGVSRSNGTMVVQLVPKPFRLVSVTVTV